MTLRSFNRILMASAAACILTFGFSVSHGPFGATAAHAQQTGGGGSGAGAGGAGGAGGQRGGSGTGKGGSQSDAGSRGKGGIEDHVFEEGEGPSDEAKGPKYGGGREVTGKPSGAGTQKGDTFSDLWVILRDDNGVPILDALGHVQPVDVSGNLIPLDAEGAPLDESLVVEVELGRTNVGRSPTKVLDSRLDEVVANINSATAVSIDASGRLVLTIDGEQKTVDSPLENLAIYEALMTTGTIAGVTDPSKLSSVAYLVDGTKTLDDMKAATSFLAAATDKEEALSVDEVVYLNTMLGIPGTITGTDGKTYVDFSTFTYDREAVFGDTAVSVLVQTSPGIYEVQTVNVYDVLFNNTDVSATGVDAFAQAADDARSVLLYDHDNAPR